MKLTIAMPTMNEEKAIKKVVCDIRKNVPFGKSEYEILIVDGSKDRTPEIARRLGVRVVRQKPQGHGVAYRECLKLARGDVVITADCDNTYPMEDIPKFLDKIEEGYHIVSGNRLNKRNRSMPAINKFGNWMFATMLKLFYGINTKDITTGMRAYTKEIAKMDNWETNYSFLAEIMIKAVKKGFKFTEFDIDYRERIGQATINRIISGRAYLLCILKYKFKLPFPNKLL